MMRVDNPYTSLYRQLVRVHNTCIDSNLQENYLRETGKDEPICHAFRGVMRNAIRAGKAAPTLLKNLKRGLTVKYSYISTGSAKGTCKLPSVWK